MSYSFLRSITVNHAHVGGALTSYPVLINSTLTYLRTVANGGQVQNANGYDIIFLSDANDETSLLNWEIEKYTATSGLIVAWVKLPTLSSSIDTVFYMKYGNAAITTFQGNVVGTWQTAFKAVWHLPGNEAGVVIPDLLDSTSNNNDGTAGGLGNQKTVPGQADGGCSFSGGGNGITCGTDSSLALQSFTVSGWFEPISIGGFGFGKTFIAKISDFSSTTTSGWGIYAKSDLHLAFRYVDSGIHDYVTGLSLVNSTRYYFGFVRDRAAGQFRTYINGVLVDTTSTSTAAITYASDVMDIGGPPGDTAGLGTGLGPYEGIQDEVRIYSGIQSAAWLLTDYNNQFSPSTFYTISAVSTAFTASCGSPPDGVQGLTYTHTFPTPVDGGLAPFIYEIVNRADALFNPENSLDHIYLDSGTGIWTGDPAAPGIYEFRLLVTDSTSREEQVDCSITVTAGVAPSAPDDWIPVPPIGGPTGWDFTGACARTGSNGLRHIADGTTAGSNARVASTVPITVEEGWTLYISFYIKGSGGADGTVGFGFMFYDVDNVFLGEAFVTSSTLPTVWTQVNGSVTVPTGAVSAIPVIQVIGHLTGTWCVDDLYAIRSGGNFILSSLKGYWTDFISYR